MANEGNPPTHELGNVEELENGVLTMVISLFTYVKDKSGSTSYAKNYVKSMLEHMIDIVTQTEKDEQEEEANND